MILVGNARAGAKELALHLLKDENERVEVRELRGFASAHLIPALQESYALSRGTRCRRHLFSLSLNPPADADPAPEIFDEAIERAEAALGLSGQPRAVVLHEKDGRKHAHAVWCRIDPEIMTARQLSFSHKRLQGLARELYREHGWEMPRGFQDRFARDPHNFSLEEWQQAKRAKKDPKRLKAMFRECWQASDSPDAFAASLRSKGYVLAKGDRRGHVAVDHEGEAYPIARWTGQKAKDVRARLGGPENLPGVDAARVQAAQPVAERLRTLRDEEARKREADARKLEAEQQAAEARARTARQELEAAICERRARDEAQRQAQIRKGLMGLLDRVTGRRKKQETEHKRTRQLAEGREHAERQKLETAQAEARKALIERQTTARDHRTAVLAELSRDIERLTTAPEMHGRTNDPKPRRHSRPRGPTPER